MKLVKYFSITFVTITLLAVVWHYYPKADMDYHNAVQANTVEAYRHFLDTYPDDQRKQNVLVRLDQVSWALVLKSNSTAAVGSYIRSFPNGKFIQEANELRDKLEVANLPGFEGIVTVGVEIGSSSYMISLKTSDAEYQILTKRSTIYKGLEVDDAGVHWWSGGRYRVRGIIEDNPPSGGHLAGVKFIEARVVELLERR
jgi:hypothetical protein